MVLIRIDAQIVCILGHSPNSDKNGMAVGRPSVWSKCEYSYGLRAISVLGHFPHHRLNYYPYTSGDPCPKQ